MAIFDWMANMAIGAAGGGKKVFGTKPGVADYTPTDLGTEAKKAADADIANSPEIQKLLETILPGYGEMVRQGSKNTLSLLKGELPSDVQDAVTRSAAYRSLSGGFSGSGMARKLTARDFGLMSLDLMGKGENSAQRWAGITQGANAPFTVTAKEQADQTMKNNLYRQAVEQFKYNVLAAPDPAAAGLFNTIGVIGGTAASFGHFGGGGQAPLQVQSGNYGASAFGSGAAGAGAAAGSGWGG